MRRICSILTTAAAAAQAHGAMIRPDIERVAIRPGDSISVLWLIEDLTTPTFGYSLDINRGGDPVSPIRSGLPDLPEIDADATDFFDERNLITAGGRTRDSLFSVILPDGAGGVFLSTNTDDGSTVLSTPGVNDVLVRTVFTAGPEASMGSFEFALGPGTALSDAAGFGIPFDARSLTITVIPTPSVSIAMFASLVMERRSRRRSRAHVTSMGLNPDAL